MSSVTLPPAVAKLLIADLRELLDCDAGRAVQLLTRSGWDVNEAVQLHFALGGNNPNIPLNPEAAAGPGGAPAAGPSGSESSAAAPVAAPTVGADAACRPLGIPSVPLMSCDAAGSHVASAASDGGAGPSEARPRGKHRRSPEGAARQKARKRARRHAPPLAQTDEALRLQLASCEAELAKATATRTTSSTTSINQFRLQAILAIEVLLNDRLVVLHGSLLILSASDTLGNLDPISTAPWVEVLEESVREVFL